MHSDSLKNKGVLITGAGRGIGKRLAIGFAAAGARVAIIGRHPERGADACEKLRARTSGGSIHFVRADASLPEDAVRAAEQAHGLLGCIDVLMCTTGPSEPPRLLHNIKIENIRLTVSSLMPR